jgi:Ala-tRNA(Pro) deacylase
MATVAWIKDMLEKRGIPYEERHHRRAFTAQEVAQAEHVSGHALAKVVIVIADGQPVELVLPASRRVVLDRVRRLVGAGTIRLASEAEMERIFTGCEAGAIPPLRHWKDVEVLMDASIARAHELVFQAGTHEDAVRLILQDWLALVSPRVEFFSEPEYAFETTTFTDRGDVGSQHSPHLPKAQAKHARAASSSGARKST